MSGSEGSSHCCGDNGGKTKNGAPCGNPVSNGGLCRYHAKSRFNPKQQAYLKALSHNLAIASAARAAGVERTTPARHWRKNPEFAEAEQAAKEEATDRLIAEAESRAVEGLRSYKFHQGSPVYIACEPDHPEAIEVQNKAGETVYVRHYYEHSKSDILLMFLIKKERPEYREKQDVNVNAHFTLADAIRTIQERRGVLTSRN